MFTIITQTYRLSIDIKHSRLRELQRYANDADSVSFGMNFGIRRNIALYKYYNGSTANDHINKSNKIFYFYFCFLIIFLFFCYYFYIKNEPMILKALNHQTKT